MPDKMEVWLDADLVAAPQRVGTLFHDRGQVWFSYANAWLKNPVCFALDPDLTLDAAPFFPKPETGSFGIFLDSSPDRWGQTLMKRREMLEARDAKRPVRNLYAWDYLVGVQDETRQGALRFRREGENTFASVHPLAAPPVTSLRALQAVAYELANKRIDDLNALRQWLSVLVAPGSSLGGARPKANFRELDGSLWIAKFPARDDSLDVGAWEGVVHSLAQDVGIHVPQAKTVRLGGDHHAFCVKRFDRNANQRVFYSSAMTLLRKEQSEGSSYLEMAHFLQTHGAAHLIEEGLGQLFRRVAFNVAVANRDDHLRNHGFLLRPGGWALAPAFDVNPNPDKSEHVLAVDDGDNRPSLDTVLLTAEWYGLKPARAEEIIGEVVDGVKKWPQVARRFGIGGAEIALMQGIFGVQPGSDGDSGQDRVSP
ncbi:type II toxin-antitoxin system HipA family toxin [Verminephrobacter aporrectodeae]|uniref:type II toxin-antitoxin system HipA family toxin n=1 Tax=Verminephrobacter aporrectodeae TaxID=1110389 RepID=UPI00023753D1|nr:HipA domain-containing protein [Verminephrobacter aporrectodeae]